MLDLRRLRQVRPLVEVSADRPRFLLRQVLPGDKAETMSDSDSLLFAINESWLFVPRPELYRRSGDD